jgi:hypothetical protein
LKVTVYVRAAKEIVIYLSLWQLNCINNPFFLRAARQVEAWRKYTVKGRMLNGTTGHEHRQTALAANKRGNPPSSLRSPWFPLVSGT